MVDGAAESEEESIRHSEIGWRTLPYATISSATNARIGDRERTAHAVAYNSEGTVVRGHTGERTYRATFV